MSEAVDEDAEDQWAARLEESALKPGPRVTARTLAAEIGPLSDAVADEVCNEAALVATADGSTAVEFHHFQAAAEEVLDDDQDDAGGQDDDVDEPAPEKMGRDELEAEIARLRRQVNGLESQVTKLQDVANRDVALHRGALNALLGDVEDVSEFPDAAADLREQLDVDEGGDAGAE